MGARRLPRRYGVAAGGASPDLKAWLLAILVGFLGGLAATIVNPILLIIALVGLSLLLIVPIKGYKVFWGYLIFLLLGYLCLGKGFAYLGASPIYVAELGLALAGISTLVIFLTNRLQTIAPFFRLEMLLLVLFVAWQAACTIPYLNVYGADALRDAALWGYSAFAIFILLLVPRESVERLFFWYGRLLPYYLVWLLAAWAFVKIEPLSIYPPGSPVPLLHLKSGDVGVHLAGAAAFMLLRLDMRGRAWSGAMLWCMWGLWVVNWLLWGATNRGGMFSALVGIAIVLLWRPRVKWYRPFVLIASIITLLFVFNASVSFEGNRSISISGQQIADNVTSTFGGEVADSGLEGTREFRLDWWKQITGYTFGGENFWMGKGYGINLADDDGHQITADESLRSPHNATMAILARSGVPGLILWSVFLVAFGSTLVRKASVRKVGYPDRKYALWLLAYWAAFLFNSSFDAFLDGPMGGVLFWSLVGLSLVYFTRRARSEDNGIATLPH